MKSRTVREVLAAALLTIVIATPAAVVTLRAQAPQNGAGGFPDLIGMLKATPGVLGVDAARGTMNGKMVIFAWFENKKAVLNWYYSDTHLQVKNQFAPGSTHTPLADVPDDGQPVLAIASLTLTGAPTGDATSLPVSQIAIELYRPLPGGLAAGGRFAPEALNVPGMQMVTLPARSKEKE